jgi:hypothetical protein
MTPASVKLWSLGHLLHRHPLSINFNKRSEATSRPPETAIQPEAFSNKHKSLENFFEANISPPSHGQFSPEDF